MKVTLLALGSRGDVTPGLILGKALRRAGHQVRFVTTANFGQLIRSAGLDFHPIQGDAAAIMRGPAGVSLSESGQSVLQMARTALRSFGSLADAISDSLSHPSMADTDLILNHLPGGLYGLELAERYGVPMIATAGMPLTPTRHMPMLAFPSWPSPIPGYNRLTHWLAYQIVWQWFRPKITQWRTHSFGLRPARLFGSERWMVDGNVPVLNGFSAHVVPAPADWGAHVHTTGYWFPEDAAWRQPDDLRRFIESGPAPVFVGFGSMTIRQPEAVTDQVLSALAQTGQRGILHAGWSGLGDGQLPPSVMRIEYADYGWLFPRMAALVHHGGAGTTADGLRAGTPSVIVPFLFDQFYWGERVRKLGVGPKPVAAKQLTGVRLATAIDMAVSDRAMRSRAQSLAEAIRAEDGVGLALSLIERFAP